MGNCRKGFKGFIKGLPSWNKGKKGYTNKGSFIKGSVCWCKDKSNIKIKGYKNPKWKGGKTKTWSNYILTLKPNHPNCDKDGYVREHRLVVEKEIGRYLLPKEVVHHLGKKTDNRPQMLMAFNSHSAHQRFERKGTVKSEEIIFDGRDLTKGQLS